MTDRILGQPSNLTVVANNGAGLVRVTYQPWELDWEWFNTIVVGHWLANTTTAVTATIAAKGGTEHLGYWFDLNVAFPSANWNTGNRIAPQRQAGIFQYATLAAAGAAGVMNDFMLMWYQNVANRRLWTEGLDILNKTFSVWGMLSRNQIIVRGLLRSRGDLSGQRLPIHLVNLTSASTITGAYSYTPTAGLAGAGLSGRRLIGITGNWGSVNNHTVGTVVFENCIHMFGANGFNGGTAINCSALFDSQSYMVLDANMRNLVAGECLTCFSGGAIAGAQNCADIDGTLPVHATNLRNQNARTQLRFFFDLASPGRKKFPPDTRVCFDSVLKAAGVNVGVAVDADDQVRPDPPSIGAWEPYAACYAPAAEPAKPPARLSAVRA